MGFGVGGWQKAFLFFKSKQSLSLSLSFLSVFPVAMMCAAFLHYTFSAMTTQKQWSQVTMD
jgi:hypothetical protein